MKDSLKGLPIFFAIDNWQPSNDVNWSYDIANSWKTGQYNDGSFWGIGQQFYTSVMRNTKSGPSQWNDLGTLFIGVNSKLTVSEEMTHFALWCFAKSPLMLSIDFTSMAPEVM